jgi:predicted PurR-regulated permease PerM
MATAPEKLNPLPLKEATLKHYNRKTERLAIFTVAGLTVIIVGLWLVSITTQFSKVLWSKSPETSLINKTSDNWKQAFHTDATSTVSIDELKTEIQNRINQITTQFSTTTSSTLPISPSSSTLTP